MQAKEIMTTELACAKTEHNIRDLAKMMKEYDTGAIPIVQEGNQLVGIVTDRDIVLRCIAEECDINQSVESIMTTNPVCASPDADLDEIADLMHDKQIKRICITEGDVIKGIISLGDLAVTDEDEAEDALEGISHGAKAEGRMGSEFRGQEGHP
jgi:CBS domain-containing protein